MTPEYLAQFSKYSEKNIKFETISLGNSWKNQVCKSIVCKGKVILTQNNEKKTETKIFFFWNF